MPAKKRARIAVPQGRGRDANDTAKKLLKGQGNLRRRTRAPVARELQKLTDRAIAEIDRLTH